MALGRLHRALDRAAMWAEDRVSRPPDPYRPGPDGPLAAFGPVEAAPPAPPGSAVWRFAPRAAHWPFPGDAVHVHRHAARGARLGSAVLVPPWKMPAPGWLRGWTALLTREGLETWLLVPPFHRERTPAGGRNGEGFVSADLGRLRLALAETVLEIRALAAAAAPAGPVGLVGLSLGALPAALAATGPERLDFAALVAPALDLASVLSATPIGARYRRLAARAGAPLPPDAELRERLAPLLPAARPPTAHRLLVVAGRDDVIAPPEQARALSEAWGAPLALHARGHLGLLLGCRAARREVGELARRALRDRGPSDRARP